MTYRAAITSANARLARDPRRIFVGYGLTRGRAGGTIPAAAEILETPVAENLMVGAAIGLSLAGRLPVVYIERADFLLNALDAIVNHLGAMAEISRGEFRPAVILRIVVGNRKKPLFTGPTHTQDFAAALQEMVNFPVFSPLVADDIESVYLAAAHDQEHNGISSAIFEHKDLL